MVPWRRVLIFLKFQTVPIPSFIFEVFCWLAIYIQFGNWLDASRFDPVAMVMSPYFDVSAISTTQTS